MKWFVYIDDRYAGTVIAANEMDAYDAAYCKWPVWGLFEIRKEHK
jgi:hypothetical protein